MSHLFQTIQRGANHFAKSLFTGGSSQVENPSKPQECDILFVGFNQRKTCVCVGSKSGFRIYQCHPNFQLAFESNIPSRQVGMLFETSLVALTGTSDYNNAAPSSPTPPHADSNGVGSPHSNHPSNASTASNASHASNHVKSRATRPPLPSNGVGAASDTTSNRSNRPKSVSPASTESSEAMTPSSPRGIILFNTSVDKEVARMYLETTVLNLKMNRSRLAVAEDKKIHLFDLKQLKRIYAITTCDNPNGIFDLCASDDNCLLAYPHLSKNTNLPGGGSKTQKAAKSSGGGDGSGQNALYNATDHKGHKNGRKGAKVGKNGKSSKSGKSSKTLSKNGTEGQNEMIGGGVGGAAGNVEEMEHKMNKVNGGGETLIRNKKSKLNANKAAHVASSAISSMQHESQGRIGIIDAYNLQIRTIIIAHDSPIQCMSFDAEGKLLATASTVGTLIRVFTVPQGKHLHSFRRGTMPTKIQSLAFNPSSTMLCASTENQTIHIFNLTQPKSEAAPLSIVADYLPHSLKTKIENPRSFAYIHLKLQVTMENDQIEAGFLNDYIVVVATKSGYFYQYRVPINGGECKLLSEHSLRESNNYQENTSVYSKEQADALFKKEEKERKKYEQLVAQAKRNSQQNEDIIFSSASSGLPVSEGGSNSKRRKKGSRSSKSKDAKDPMSPDAEAGEKSKKRKKKKKKRDKEKSSSLSTTSNAAPSHPTETKDDNYHNNEINDNINNINNNDLNDLNDLNDNRLANIEEMAGMSKENKQKEKNKFKDFKDFKDFNNINDETDEKIEESENKQKNSERKDGLLHSEPQIEERDDGYASKIADNLDDGVVASNPFGSILDDNDDNFEPRAERFEQTTALQLLESGNLNLSDEVQNVAKNDQVAVDPLDASDAMEMVGDAAASNKNDNDALEAQSGTNASSSDVTSDANLNRVDSIEFSDDGEDGVDMIAADDIIDGSDPKAQERQNMEDLRDFDVFEHSAAQEARVQFMDAADDDAAAPAREETPTQSKMKATNEADEPQDVVAMKDVLGADSGADAKGKEKVGVGDMDAEDMADIPDMPDMPDMPDIPDMVEIPDITDANDVTDDATIPDIPEIPDITDVPDVPDVPSVPDAPGVFNDAGAVAGAPTETDNAAKAGISFGQDLIGDIEESSFDGHDANLLQSDPEPEPEPAQVPQPDVQRELFGKEMDGKQDRSDGNLIESDDSPLKNTSVLDEIIDDFNENANEFEAGKDKIGDVANAGNAEHMNELDLIFGGAHDVVDAKEKQDATPLNTDRMFGYDDDFSAQLSSEAPMSRGNEDQGDTEDTGNFGHVGGVGLITEEIPDMDDMDDDVSLSGASPLFEQSRAEPQPEASHKAQAVAAKDTNIDMFDRVDIGNYSDDMHENPHPSGLP